MKKDTDKAKELLLAHGYTCVLVKGNEVISSRERGVAPLLEIIDSGRDVSAFSAADKVVGKGAALLYILMGVQSLHGEIMSKKAAEVLEMYDVSFTFSTLAEYIVNRKGDGMCPMEKATLDTDDPRKGYEAIVACRAQLQRK